MKKRHVIRDGKLPASRVPARVLIVRLAQFAAQVHQQSGDYDSYDDPHTALMALEAVLAEAFPYFDSFMLAQDLRDLALAGELVSA